MTDKEATKLCNEWVEILGLQDWEIHLYWQCKPDEIPVHEAEGATVLVESTKEAQIFILDEKYAKCEPFKFDFERDLVHELLHLKTNIMTDENEHSYQARLMHTLVDDMAKAFVKVKRKYKEKTSG